MLPDLIYVVFMSGYFAMLGSPVLLPAAFCAWSRWRKLKQIPAWRFRYSISELWGVIVSVSLPAWLFAYNLRECLNFTGWDSEVIEQHEIMMGLSITILMAQILGMLNLKFAWELEFRISEARTVLMGAVVLAPLFFLAYAPIFIIVMLVSAQ